MTRLWHGCWSLFLVRSTVVRRNKVRKVCSLVRKGEVQVPNLCLSKADVVLMPLERNLKFCPESTGKVPLERQSHLKERKKEK